MYNSLARFLRDESGATAIEYGLIAALIAVVIIGACFFDLSCASSTVLSLVSPFGFH